MREHHSELTATGYKIIAITPANQSLLEQFVEVFGPFPFALYGDPSRELYRSMGHVSMKKWKLLLKAAGAYVKGGSKMFMPEGEAEQKVVREAMKTQDIFIQGGSWLFNQKGEVIWNHIDQSPEDHAKINELLSVMKKK